MGLDKGDKGDENRTTVFSAVFVTLTKQIKFFFVVGLGDLRIALLLLKRNDATNKIGDCE